MIRILFLDFDGVLRPVESPRAMLDPRCLDAFAKAISPFPELRIVISSTWRQAFSISELRQALPATIASRVVGVTPELLHDSSERGNRQREIERYCVVHAVMSDEWLAIDDNELEFEPSAPLLHVNPTSGFDEFCVSQLWERLGRD